LNLTLILLNYFMHMCRYVKKYNLPTSEASVRHHVEKLLHIQDSSDVVLATKLTAEMLTPKSWESMRVSDALNLFDEKV
jgi:hypothetical protein